MRNREAETNDERVVLDLLEEKFGLTNLSVWDLRCVDAALHALKIVPYGVTTAGGEKFDAFDVTERLADDLRVDAESRMLLAEWEDARHTATKTSEKMNAAARVGRAGKCHKHMWRKRKSNDQPTCMACGAVRE